MRTKLKAANNQRLRFKAKVERFGIKPNYHGFPEKTILLTEVKFLENNRPATDHIWFTVGKTFEALNLKPGDSIEFDARIGEYVKGYVNHREYIDDREIDYKLTRPTKMAKVK